MPHRARASTSSTSSTPSTPLSESSRVPARSASSSSSNSSSAGGSGSSLHGPSYRGPQRDVRTARTHQHARGAGPDLAQHAPAPQSPPPALTSERSRLMRVQYDAMGAFFGGGRVVEQPTTPVGRRSSDSLSRGSSEVERTQAFAPPPYASRSDIESLPQYSINEYDAELNRKLFIYGFIFFPLWIVGFIAPFVKPHRDPTRDNKTKEQADEEDAAMRVKEMKWAWRCLFALLTLVIIITIAIVVGVTVAHRT